MDRGDVWAALGSLDQAPAELCQEMVTQLADVLCQASLVMDQSLLPCGKPVMKACVKVYILICFLGGNSEHVKTLTFLYCYLAHFQDIGQAGLLAFNGPEELLDIHADSPELAAKAKLCASAVRTVSSDFNAFSNEMVALSAKLELFCEASRPCRIQEAAAWGSAAGPIERKTH